MLNKPKTIVDGDTSIPTCDNQLIKELAYRIVAHCGSPMEGVNSMAVEKVKKVLCEVYFAGYQRGQADGAAAVSESRDRQ